MRDILFYDSIFLLKIKYCLFKSNLILVNQVKGGGGRVDRVYLESLRIVRKIGIWHFEDVLFDQVDVFGGRLRLEHADCAGRDEVVVGRMVAHDVEKCERFLPFSNGQHLPLYDLKTQGQRVC